MSLYPMRSGQLRTLLAEAGAALAAAVLIAGCGNNYRPVVTPVSTSGPPAQATAYAVVVSSTSASSPGVASIIDYSGDSVMAAAPIGVGPIAFTMDEIAGTGYTYNSDHTVTNFPISTTQLQPRNEYVTTLPANAQPINLMAPNSGMWIGDRNGDVVDLFAGSPQKFTQAIPMAPASDPVFIAGAPTSSGQRQYIINQNIPGSNGMECNLTPAAEPLGTAVPVEIAGPTLDVPLRVGRCPVFAVQSTDERRLFVLNRGDDTITVINSQTNALDNDCPPPSGCVNQNGQQYFSHPTLPLSTSAVTRTGITPPNGITGMGTVAGPVYAEFNAATNQLVVANYDGGTISVIDVSLDQYGNDSPTFGTTYTIPVGANPASVTVLYDGSRAYSANQGDGTVTIVNLSSHSVEKTLAVVGHPRTVVSTQNSLYGKVYAAAPDSPYLTILETEHDLVDTTVLTQGNIVDVQTTNQSGGSVKVNTYNGTASLSNIHYSSRVPGYGQPCNLPPLQMLQKYGAGYTLADCQAIP